MAERDQFHGDDAGFVTLFAQTPQLCAGTLAGVASALWLNVVGPFAGLLAAWGALILVNALAIAVVCILAILVTTAGTLLAADWRAEAASHQAWAECDIDAVGGLHLPTASVASSQIDPRYLIVPVREDVQSILRGHRFTSSAPAVDAGAEVGVATCTVVAASTSIPASLTQDAAPNVATAHSRGRRTASVSLGQKLRLVSSCRARPQVLRAEPASSAARLVANVGAWSELLPHHRCVLTRGSLDRHVADIVVLSGDLCDRNQPNLPGPSTGNGTVKIDEPPSCRGPPMADGQRTRPTETVTVERLAKDRSKAPVVGAPRPADPIVCDNFGCRVAVCAAELDVIETYLGRALQDLLGPGASVPDREKS